MAEKKCKNRYLFTKSCYDPSFNWKTLGIECKLTELFENTEPEEWNDEQFIKITTLVAPYVFHLDIRRLIPINAAFVEKNKYNPLYKICNYPAKDCHHANLGLALVQLVNLKSLSLQYGVECMKYKFDRRCFEISYQDIEWLAE